MLKGISPFVNGALLSILDRMGHGDELVIADAHFPSHSVNPTVLSLPGAGLVDILDGILPLLEIDSYVPDAVVMVEPVPGDAMGVGVLEDVKAVLAYHHVNAPPIVFEERFRFYDRARKAFAVLSTGETRKYGNVLVKKGVTPATWKAFRRT